MTSLPGMVGVDEIVKEMYRQLRAHPVRHSRSIPQPPRSISMPIPETIPVQKVSQHKVERVMRNVIIVGSGFPNMLLARLIEALPPRTYVMGSTNSNAVSRYAVTLARKLDDKSGGYIDIDKLSRSDWDVWRIFVLVRGEGDRVIDLPPILRLEGARLTIIDESENVGFDGTTDEYREMFADRTGAERQDIINAIKAA